MRCTCQSGRHQVVCPSTVYEIPVSGAGGLGALQVNFRRSVATSISSPRVTLFCPKCGDAMTSEVNRSGAPTLRCVRGGMQLSFGLRELLEADLANAHGRPAAIRADEGHSAPLFCVRCATPLRRHDRTALPAECPSCGFLLSGRAVYHLVELHPHRPDTARG